MSKRKTIIIPDAHGRTFWKEAAERFPEEDFIFLGDYLDPYYLDVIYCSITPDRTIENFEEILAFKKGNPVRVALLLGNHDCEYIYGKNVCNCRCDTINYKRIQELFRENRDLFDLAAERVLGGRHFLFSHAGIKIGWMKKHFPDWDFSDTASLLNGKNREALEAESPENTAFAAALSEADCERSGKLEFGSPVWADAEKMNEGPHLPGVIQVVGHSSTRHASPVLTDSVLYTDCARALYLGERGVLYRLDGKRCRNEYGDPFHPDPDPDEYGSFGFDLFTRPFCRNCGSHRIFIRAGMFVDHWYCKDCNNDAFL